MVIYMQLLFCQDTPSRKNLPLMEFLLQGDLFEAAVALFQLAETHGVDPPTGVRSGQEFLSAEESPMLGQTGFFRLSKRNAPPTTST